MLRGFKEEHVDVGDATIHTATAGNGPPLLLLHGYPQTKAMWHKIVHGLTERFTVVATDLRGYGRSSKPPGAPGHENYSKRSMAADQVAVMKHLGFDTFRVAAHDRGARVAHRMALDYQNAVVKLALLDIAPTATMYATATMRLATAYYHWYFLVQPHDLPERLIGSDPAYYLRRKLEAWSRTPGAFSEEAIVEYIRCFEDPATIHATCEDYRAAASIDLEHDALDAGQMMRQPLLVLWGELGVVGQEFDVLDVWKKKAADVRGAPVRCGHFLAEEAPEDTLTHLLQFLP